MTSSTGILSSFISLVTSVVILATPQTALCRDSSLPEVANLRFNADKETLTWSSLAANKGYHVYRGILSELRSGDYGECIAGSIQRTSVAVPDEPVTGTCYIYLVGGFDEEGAGTLGSSSAGAERIPSVSCITARRFFDLTINGDPGDGVEDGVGPRRNPDLQMWSSSREQTGVYLHTGEFFLTSTDLSIPGRDLDWSFTRSYRSQISFDGPLGHNWDFTDNARLAPLGADVLYLDGSGRSDRFNREDAGHFTSPWGLYAVLIQNPDSSFTLRYPDGTLSNFHGFDGSNLEGAVESVEDASGSLISYIYDHQGLLTTIVDTMGRVISYEYDPLGRLKTLTDYHGRSCVFTYDSNGDLTEVRSPVVTGTPNGNDFPAGKTTSYTYSSGFASASLNHNLTSVISPNEYSSSVPHLQNSYGSDPDPTVFEFDRVVSQMIGGVNGSGVAAGGTLTYSYASLNPGSNLNDPAIERRKAIIYDRNGNQEEHIHNYSGNPLKLTEFTNRNLRPGESDYITTSTYNNDGETLQIHMPSGNSVIFTYDSPGADRFRDGNLLEKRYVADTFASGGRGNGHGSEAADIVWTYSYEPVFNQLATLIEPRGNDTGYIPQNGGAQSPERYRKYWTYDYQEGDPAANGINDLAARFGIDLGTTPFNLGDINADGSVDQAIGRAVRIADPTVNLDPSSNQAAIQGDTTQEIATLYQYNSHGQVTRITDAEENRHEFTYFPESDPDGDGSTKADPPDGRLLDTVGGGYVAASFFDVFLSAGRNNRTDPTPAEIREDYSYDPVGNRISKIDGRGIRTRYVYNQLNQIMEVRRAASTADTSGPDGDPATGRGETGLTAYGYKISYEYDANDNIIGYDREDRGSTRGIGTYAETSYAYDILDNPIELQREATASKTLITGYGYDANENQTQLVEPAGNTHEQAFDERDLLLSMTRGSSGPRGGTASKESYDYNGNGSVSRITDGRGNPTNISYDGFDRPARTIDQIGNTIDLYYDPASNVTRELARGPIGGATPPDRSGATNVLLADSAYLYDEMSRPFRHDRSLFVPSGAVPYRTPILNEGSLIAGDGFINTIYEYDRLSRNTFLVKDSTATTRLDYDGAGRLLKQTDAGNNITEYTYDDNDNLIESGETEISSASGPPPELFLTTSFFDALDRQTRVVDNAGQTWNYFYDSLDAVTTITDPNGPAGGTINRRSPGHEGMTANINTNGNGSRYSYDGCDRRYHSIRILTPSGLGDGTTNPPRDTSNIYNPDGEITLTTAWDDNSLIMEQTDDRGNITSYSYDNLSRLVRRTADDDTFWQGSYDQNDNLTSITDANGSVISNIFDNADRKIRTNVSRASGIEGTTQQIFEYDGMGRLTKATDNNDPSKPNDNAIVTFIYDSLGRVLEEGQKLEGETTTKYSDSGWLAEDLQTDIIYPSGRNIDYSYDAADRLASIGDSGRPESASFKYFGLTRLHTRQYGNTIRSTRLNDAGTSDIGYDSVKRTTLLRHLDSMNMLKAGFAYSFDRAGNPLSVRRTHHGDGINFRGEKYGFDSANRLIHFQEGTLDPSLSFIPPILDEQHWTLDGAGNWPEMIRNAIGYLATPNNLNEYDEMQSGGTRVDDGLADDFLDPAATPGKDGLNLAHSKNGEQIKNGNHEIRYNAMSLPVRAARLSDGLDVASYSYDALGRRVRSIVTNSGSLNGTSRYFYGRLLTTGDFEDEEGYHPGGCSGEESAMIETRDGLDSTVRQVVYAHGQALWQLRSEGGPTEAHYFLEDGLGSTAALSHGLAPSVLERVTYDPYGKPVFETPLNEPIFEPSGAYLAQSEYGNANLFTGKLYDPELGLRTGNPNTDLGGLYIFDFDYYEPDQGRFLTRSADPFLDGLASSGNAYLFNCRNPIKVTRTVGEVTPPDIKPIRFELASIRPSSTGSLPSIVYDWTKIWKTRQQCVKLYRMIKTERKKVADLNKKMRALKTCSSNVWKAFEKEKAKFLESKTNIDEQVLTGDLRGTDEQRKKISDAKKRFNQLMKKSKAKPAGSDLATPFRFTVVIIPVKVCLGKRGSLGIDYDAPLPPLVMPKSNLDPLERKYNLFDCFPTQWKGVEFDPSSTVLQETIRVVLEWVELKPWPAL